MKPMMRQPLRFAPVRCVKCALRPFFLALAYLLAALLWTPMAAFAHRAETAHRSSTLCPRFSPFRASRRIQINRLEAFSGFFV
jgi:hypothetical protein